MTAMGRTILKQQLRLEMTFRKDISPWLHFRSRALTLPRFLYRNLQLAD
jgi:hypothetical protein